MAFRRFLETFSAEFRSIFRPKFGRALTVAFAKVFDFENRSKNRRKPLEKPSKIARNWLCRGHVKGAGPCHTFRGRLTWPRPWKLRKFEDKLFHTSTTLNASRAKDEKTREKTQKQQEKAKKCCFLIGCWFYAPGLNVSHSNIDRINYYVIQVVPYGTISMHSNV